MRNPADFLVLHKLARAIFRVKGISRVQGITRPEGTPIEHTSIPFLISMQNAGQMQDMKYIRGTTNDLLKQADMLATQIVLMKRMYECQKKMTEITHQTFTETKDLTLVVNELRDN